MNNYAASPVRKRLDHRGPLSVDVLSAWYFITICAEGHEAWKMGRACAPRTPDFPDGRAGAPRTPDVPDGRAGAPRTPDVPDGRAGAPRTPYPPTFDSIAELLMQHAREYHQMGKWFISLFLVMPDHLHFIVKAVNWDGVRGAPALPVNDHGVRGAPALPVNDHGVRGAPALPVNDHGVRGAPVLPRLIANWKHWLTANYGIRFQVNFFDTRLRDDAHYAEKFHYICNNPVRKGLCATARDWPYVIAFSRETGDELEHR